MVGTLQHTFEAKCFGVTVLQLWMNRLQKFKLHYNAIQYRKWKFATPPPGAAICQRPDHGLSSHELNINI